MSNNNNNEASSGKSSQGQNKTRPSGFYLHKPDNLLSPMSKARRLARKSTPSKNTSQLAKPSISPLIFPSQYNKEEFEGVERYEVKLQELTWEVKALHKASRNHNTNIPSDDILYLEKSINDFILNSFENDLELDNFLEYVYRSNKLNIEQKCILREIVVNLFANGLSVIQEEDKESQKDEEISLASVFAIPMFGKVSSFMKLASNQSQISKLCNLVVDGGYLSSDSKVIALMNKPLNPRALYQPSVLRSLSIYWASLVSDDNKDNDFDSSIRELIEKNLEPYLVDEDQTCSFVIPGIRIWNGPRKQRNKLVEIFNKFNQSPAKKSTYKSWWQTVSGHIALSSGVKPGELLIKPPSSPLSAHAKSVAWHMTQQVYEGLNSKPFSEISLVSTTPASKSLSLRAYDKNKKIITQSDPIPLFEATTSSDDFSSLIYEECSADGPRTLLRETLRTLDSNP